MILISIIALFAFPLTGFTTSNGQSGHSEEINFDDFPPDVQEKIVNLLDETAWFQLRTTSKKNLEIKYNGLDVKGVAASIKKKCAQYNIMKILEALKSTEVPKEIDVSLLNVAEVTKLTSCLDFVNHICDTSPELKNKVITMRVSMQETGKLKSFEQNEKRSGCTYDLRLTGSGTRFATFFSERLHLAALDLSRRHLGWDDPQKYDPDIVEKLFDSLRTQPKLKALNLKYALLSGEVVMNQVLAHLSKLSSLEVLDLSQNFIGPQGAIKISKSLSQLPAKLKQLNFGENNFGRKGTAEILQSLANHKELEVLDLSYNKKQSSYSAVFTSATEIAAIFKGIAAIFKDIKNIPKLQQLNLQGNYMGFSATLRILDALLGRKDLKVLNLAENDLGYVGAAKVATILKNENFAPKLTQLNLRGNNMGFNGIMEVLKSLVNQNELRVLDIGKAQYQYADKEKNLNPSEAEALGKLLENKDIAPKLEQLNLNYLITNAEGIGSMRRLKNTRSNLRITLADDGTEVR